MVAKWKDNEHWFGQLPTHCFGDDLINNYLFIELFRTCNTYNIGMDSHAGFHSMESRAPYLRQKLVRGMMNCDSQKKLRLVKDVELSRTGHDKYYLRELFRNELPRVIRHRKIKAGFCTPFGEPLNPKFSRRSRVNMIDDIQEVNVEHSSKK